MNILIPNSWLCEYIETDASVKEFAEAMSLTSVSIERIEEIDNDFIFDIEVTTNRPDLMSVIGIAREASAVLPQAGYKAIFKPIKEKELITVNKSPLLQIENDPELVNRILAVVMDIKLSQSPNIFRERLEKTGIRSINNVVDVTNYIMRETGHPAHVFDFDRLKNHKLIIRKSKDGEKLITLDEKEYKLSGGDIIADNGEGEIIDLLGIMGTSNSVVNDNTKRIVLFLDNNSPQILRKTSMALGIRTEAAVINEKGVDPELMAITMQRGIEYLEKYASGKLVSGIIDIYPNKVKKKNVSIEFRKISYLMGLDVPQKTVVSILNNLGFETRVQGDLLDVVVPTSRINDIDIPEDIIEEVARVYGYHKIPNKLPTSDTQNYYHQDKNEFFWIQKIKNALKYWGFNELYTYSMVSEELFDGPIEKAIKLKNPLTEDHIYLRNSLTPSILQIIDNNKNYPSQMLFEVANVYIKKDKGLPDERLHLAGAIKKDKVDFYDAKGIVEQLLNILGVSDLNFKKKDDGINGALILIGNETIGVIEEDEEVIFELDLTKLLTFATSRKIYKEPNKYPPIIEDLRVELPTHYTFKKIEESVKGLDELIHDVSLLDVYKNKKTFRITFLNRKRSLTNDEVVPIREKIITFLESEFKAKIG